MEEGNNSELMFPLQWELVQGNRVGYLDVGQWPVSK